MPTTLPMLLYLAAVGHALHRRDSSGSRAWVPLLAAGAVAVPAGAYVGVDGSGEWTPFTSGVSFLVGIGLFAGFHAGPSQTVGRHLVVPVALRCAASLVSAI